MLNPFYGDAQPIVRPQNGFTIGSFYGGTMWGDLLAYRRFVGVLTISSERANVLLPFFLVQPKKGWWSHIGPLLKTAKR